MPPFILITSALLALISAWSLVIYAWWNLASVRAENRELRYENERLLGRIGWEYGLHLGRTPFSPPSSSSASAPTDDLTPSAPYFAKRPRY